jgi:hypothetical protein
VHCIEDGYAVRFAAHSNSKFSLKIEHFGGPFALDVILPVRCTATHPCAVMIREFITASNLTVKTCYIQYQRSNTFTSCACYVVHSYEDCKSTHDHITF